MNFTEASLFWGFLLVYGVVILVLVLHAWIGLRLERQRLRISPAFCAK